MTKDISVHVRLSEDADAMLELLATAQERTKTEVAATVLHKSLLGEGYALRVAAERFARLGFRGTDRD